MSSPASRVLQPHPLWVMSWLGPESVSPLSPAERVAYERDVAGARALIPEDAKEAIGLSEEDAAKRSSDHEN